MMNNGVTINATRKAIDVVKNNQGEVFMDFLRSTETLCVANWRKGKNALMNSCVC